MIPSWPRLFGVDFTSSPTRRKPITVAQGRNDGVLMRFECLRELSDFHGFELLLRESGHWFGAFDFPFGLPRGFVEAQGLGVSTDEVIGELQRRCGDRMGLRRLVDSWGNAQPAGHRLLHRRTDRAMPGVTSSSPLQTRYVPVGFMYFEGVSRLVAADVTLPGMRVGAPDRVAIEGYPGLLAHALIGKRSYKNRDDPDRRIARKEIVDALEEGSSPLGMRLELTHVQREALVADAGGDRLDAALCLLQAGWAAQQPNFGLPPDMDPVEGWIATAPF